ncbi:MAG: hypothetical protein U1D69_07465 [Polynucleobacter sp.]|nr:hypothetical protein [Polynucleobacter sp.]
MTRKIPAIHAPMALLAGSLLALCITAGCTAPAPAPVENKGMSDLLKRAQSIHEMVLCSEFSRKDEIGPRDSDDLSKVSRTANSGAPTCQYLLGRWNELGQGIPVNYQAALQLYESAAPSYPLAYVALGRMAELGRGRPLSISDAFTLYQYASAADEPSGDVALGRFYEQGLVVNKAPNLAASLYRIAAFRMARPGSTSVHI